MQRQKLPRLTTTICGSVNSRTMNLILFTDSDRLESSKIALRGRRLQHLRQIHRANSGDILRVGEIDGLMGEGEILEINDEFATLAISLHQPPPEKLPLSLVLALPRPKMLRRILRTIAELGVPELHLINSYRVEKSYWQSPALEQDTVRDYLLLGLEQSRDTQVPTSASASRIQTLCRGSLANNDWRETRPAGPPGRTVFMPTQHRRKHVADHRARGRPHSL